MDAMSITSATTKTSHAQGVVRVRIAAVVTPDICERSRHASTRRRRTLRDSAVVLQRIVLKGISTTVRTRDGWFEGTEVAEVAEDEAVESGTAWSAIALGGN